MVNWLYISLIGISLAVLAIAIYFGFKGNKSLLRWGFAAFATLLIFAHINQIKSFRIGINGLQAETKGVIGEARNTIKEMQALAKVMARTTLSLTKRHNRLGGYSDDEENEIFKSVKDVLNRLGIPAKEQEEIFSEWYKINDFDYVYYILCDGAPIKGLASDQQKERMRLINSGLTNVPSPEEVENFLRNAGLLSDKNKELLEDLKYYKVHRKHRRPSEWKRRWHWCKN